MELLYLNLLFIDIIGGGSGRLFELYNGITIRYILFFTGILLILIKFSLKKIILLKRELIALLLGTIFIPIGLICASKNNLELAFVDIQPLLFFLLIVLILSQNREDGKYLIGRFLKFLLVIPFIMGVIQLIIISSIKLNLISFEAVYAYASTTSGELRFRGEDGLFFYKGFFFLGVGFVYAFIKKKYLLSLFLIICITLTQTRGLLLASIFTILLYLVFTARKQVAFIIFLISPIMLYLTYLFTVKILFLREDVGESDSVRFEDLDFILNSNSWVQTLIGNGWGAEVRDRAKIENVFIEIFYKCGLLGLLSSLVLVFYMFLYKNIKYNPFFYLMLFAFMYSQTNPFIFTPMGIVLVGMCILSCRFKFNKNNELIKDA